MPASTPRTRLIFQNLDLYVGPAATSGDGATGAMFQFGGTAANSGNNLIAQLPNVQSANLSVGINRQDVNVFGQLQRLGTVQVTPPSVSLDFTYLPTDGYAEYLLGFDTDGNSFLSGILTKASDSKNYFLAVSQQGVDDNLVTDPNKRDLYAVGNGFIANYQFDVAVGQIPTANVTVDAMTFAGYTGSSGLQSPAIIPAASTQSPWLFALPPGRTITGANGVIALRPGDIQLSFPTAGGFLVPLSGTNAINIQSVSLSVPIGRENLNRLGTVYGFSREITFPVNCTMNIRALATEIQTGSLATLYCNDQYFDYKITCMQPACPGLATQPALIWGFNRGQVTNISWGNTLGGNGTVDITVQGQLAGATSLNGVTFSGMA